MKLLGFGLPSKEVRLNTLRLPVETPAPTTAGDPRWLRAESLRATLTAVPLGLQPSAYLLESYAMQSWGSVRDVIVRGWADAHTLALRLEWSATQPASALDGPDRFLDRVALLFPLADATPLATMGAPGAGAILWTWRGDGKTEVLHAEGPGSIRPLTAAKVRGHGEWRDGHWRVVLNGPRPAGDRFSLAVWSGRNRERAGLKAFAPEWIKMAA